MRDEHRRIPKDQLKEYRGTSENLKESAVKALSAMMGKTYAPPPGKKEEYTQDEEVPVSKPRNTITEDRVPAQVSSSGFVYGDGNLCEAGDLVMKGNTLAEVKIIAGNGIVLEIPAEGKFVVQGSELLQYTRVGNRNRK